MQFGLASRTLVFNVEDLEAPFFAFAHSGPTRTIDHNLYVRGNRVFEANYTSGLRSLELGDLAANELAEIAYFDTFPASDAVVFDGAWSVYPYLPSGNVIVNDISNGLFILGLDVLTVFAGNEPTGLWRADRVSQRIDFAPRHDRELAANAWHGGHDHRRDATRDRHHFTEPHRAGNLDLRAHSDRRRRHDCRRFDGRLCRHPLKLRCTAARGKIAAIRGAANATTRMAREKP